MVVVGHIRRGIFLHGLRTGSLPSRDRSAVIPEEGGRTPRGTMFHHAATQPWPPSSKLKLCSAGDDMSSSEFWDRQILNVAGDFDSAPKLNKQAAFVLAIALHCTMSGMFPLDRGS